MKERLLLQLIVKVERPALTISLRKNVAERVTKETGVTPDSPIKERVQALKGLEFGAGLGRPLPVRGAGCRSAGGYDPGLAWSSADFEHAEPSEVGGGGK